jgi:hypothetical protein
VRRVRFTIGGLLGAVLFAAVAFAALREADEFWDSAVFTATLSVLLASVLLAAHRTGGRRAFWLGFALFGGAYLTASLVPAVGSRLLTTRGLTFLDSKMPGRDEPVKLMLRWTNTPRGNNTVASVAFSPDGRTLAATGQGVVRLWDVAAGKAFGISVRTTESFLGIGHSLLALLLALLGGYLSRRLHSPGRTRVDDERATPPSGTPSACP